MSSLHNQPVVEDIVSAFETTQTQSWSIFNGKLGSIPFKNCKKNDIFKSENPIELSDEDIHVFGLVPRLEKLVLVSCTKCSMIVKRDCIHYHYKRRHNNPENDNFALERFILPNAKINKHKKQRINVRKVPEKKITDGEITDPVVQEIKTEFDQLEYERLLKVNRLKIKQEIETNDDDEDDINVHTNNYNPSTNSNVLDWTFKPLCNQTSVHYTDHKNDDTTPENVKDFKKLSTVVVPVNIKEVQSNKCLDIVLKNENNINYVTSSSELLNKSFGLNEESKSKIVLDFSNVVIEEYIECNSEIGDNYNNDKLSSGLQNNSDHLFSTKDSFLGITNNTNGDISNDIDTSCNQSSIMPIEVKQEVDSIPTCNTYSNTVQIKKEIDEINDNSKIVHHHLHTKLLDNIKLERFNQSYLDPMINESSNNSIINYYPSSTALVDIKKEIEIKPDFKYSNVKVKEEYDENNDKLNLVDYQIHHGFTDTEQMPYLTPSYQYFEQSPIESLKIKNEFNTTPPIKYLHDVNFKKEYVENNDKSKFNFFPLTSKLLNNETQTKCLLTNKYSKVFVKEKDYETDDKSKILKIKYFPNILNSRINTKCIPNNMYSNIVNIKEEIYENCDKSKIELQSELLNNETQTKVLANNKYSNNTINTYFKNVSDNSHLSICPFDVKKETKLLQNNEYTTIINNKGLIDAVTSYDQSSTVLPDFMKKSNHGIDDEEKDDDDVVGGDDDTKYEYYQLATGYHKNIALATLSSSNRELYLESDDEHNYETKDNNLLTCDQQNNEDKTKQIPYCEYLDNESSDNTDCDQLQNIKEEFKHIPVIEYSDIMIDNTNVVSKFENEYYELTTGLLNNDKQFTSLDIKKETDSIGTYSDLSMDDSSNYSVTSSDQSTTPSQESKSTQTDLFLNQINHKKCLDPIIRIDELIAESLGIMDDKTKCTQTDVVFDCKDCYKITENLIDGYIPSNSAIVDNLINSFTLDRSKVEIDKNSLPSIPVNYNAQIMNNTFIPTSAEGCELLNGVDHNHRGSNDSSYLSWHQPTFWNPGSLADKSKQEYIFHRNGSSHINKSYVIPKNLIKKSIGMKVVFNKNCKLIPHTFNHIGAKVERNLKRRLGERVVNDKENQNRWITGRFKKLKRIEFIKRKIIYTDEPANNDIDE